MVYGRYGREFGLISECFAHDFSLIDLPLPVDGSSHSDIKTAITVFTQGGQVALSTNCSSLAGGHLVKEENMYSPLVNIFIFNNSRM